MLDFNISLIYGLIKFRMITVPSQGLKGFLLSDYSFENIIQINIKYLNSSIFMLKVTVLVLNQMLK